MKKGGFVDPTAFKAFASVLDGVARRASGVADSLSSKESFTAIDDLFSDSVPRRLVNPLAGVASDPVSLGPMDIKNPGGSP